MDDVNINEICVHVEEVEVIADGDKWIKLNWMDKQSGENETSQSLDIQKVRTITILLIWKTFIYYAQVNNIGIYVKLIKRLTLNFRKIQILRLHRRRIMIAKSRP